MGLFFGELDFLKVEVGVPDIDKKSDREKFGGASKEIKAPSEPQNRDLESVILITKKSSSKY